MDKARFNKNVTPEVDWQGRVIGYWAKRLLPSLASASKGQDDLDAINPAAFEPDYTPFGHAGEPQDPPEPWPSDKTATWVGPPNCEGYGHTLAHAQHEAAIDGDGCTAGACLLTRGSD